MTASRRDTFRAQLERFHVARRSASARTSEVLGSPLSDLTERALVKRQRAAQRAIDEALCKRYGAKDAREIAFHLTHWFEQAAFLVALQLDPKPFSKAEIEAGVSDVLEHVLDHVWEAARVAGVPLPCLEGDEPDADYDEDT